MPYQLNFAGNTTTLQRRIAPFPLPTNYTQDMRIDVTFVHAASGGYQAVLQTPEISTNNNNFFVGCAPSGVFYFWCNGSQLDSTVTPVAGQEYVISISINTSKNVGIAVNGGSYAYKSYPNLSAALYNQILCGGTTNNAGTFRDPFVGQLRRVETWVSGVKTGDYTNTTGTGTTMVNAIGGGVATQAGTWPAGDAEWVFYSSGATAYSDTLLAGSYAHSGSLLNSAVGYSSLLQAGSFTHSGSQLSSSVARSSTLLAGSYTHSGSALGSAVGYSSTLQGGDFSYSGSELQSIISNGAQNYSDTLLGGSFTHSGSVIQSTIARNSTLLAGSYSHAGSSLTASLSFYSTLDGGSYSHFGSMLQSTVSGQVTVSIEGYTITFAADDVSGAFAADTVAATFINDYVSATWSN